MADIKLDLLGLKYSENFSITGLEEANIDLNLSPAAEIFSTLFGVVTDGQNPIANATVKVFDSNGMPYKHTLTDENGNYTISELPAGTYSIGAVKDGYRLSNTQGVTLNNSDTIKIDLVCIADETLNTEGCFHVKDIKALLYVRNEMIWRELVTDDSKSYRIMRLFHRSLIKALSGKAYLANAILNEISDFLDAKHIAVNNEYEFKFRIIELLDRFKKKYFIQIRYYNELCRLIRKL